MDSVSSSRDIAGEGRKYYGDSSARIFALLYDHRKVILG